MPNICDNDDGVKKDPRDIVPPKNRENIQKLREALEAERGQPKLIPKESITAHFGKDFLPFYQSYIEGQPVKSGAEFAWPCPFHQDTKPSFHVNPGSGLFNCFGCGAHGDIFHFHEMKEGSADFDSTVISIAARFGISNGSAPAPKPVVKDSNKPEEPKKPKGREGPKREVAVYDYTDASGKMVSQAVRYEFDIIYDDGSSKIDKIFRQRRPTDTPGEYIWKLDGVEPPLYRLPEVVKADEVFFVEGEKDADNLVRLGAVATTNVGGAGKKWKPSYTEALKGKTVVIIPDCDKPGEAHAEKVALALQGAAMSVKVLNLPNPKRIKGYDISDFINDAATPAGAIESIMALVKSTVEWKPAVKPADKDEEEKDTQGVELIKIGTDAELFQSPEGLPWARFEKDGHRETSQIGGQRTSFRNMLVTTYYNRHGRPANPTAIAQAVEYCAAVAGDKEQPIFVRVGHKDGRIYLDLADDSWRAIEIGPEEWKIIKDPPVCFRRAKGMLSLPEPSRDGDLGFLDHLLLLENDDDRAIVYAFLSFMLNPKGPYPILGLISEHGSGKTTLVNTLRSIIDPSVAKSRSMPKNIEDLALNANNSWVLSYDNLSGIKDFMSDALCQIATGGGFATRAHYTNDEEAIFYNCRAIILNGITDFIARPDLLSRSLIISLPAIEEEVRLDEKDLSKMFAEAHPSVLGALLDLAVIAMRDAGKVRLKRRPRMSDFGTWTAAIAPALGYDPQALVGMICDRQEEAMSAAAETPISKAIIEAVERNHGKIDFSMSEFLSYLNDSDENDKLKKTPGWPKAPNQLSGEITRVKPVLRMMGIKVEKTRDMRGSRVMISREIDLEKPKTGA